MRSIEWRYFQWPWLTLTTQTTPFPTCCIGFLIFVVGRDRDCKFGNWTYPISLWHPDWAWPPSEFRRDLWHQKTRVRGLSYGIVCAILRLAVLLQCRLVTDRQTDRWTYDDSIYRASIALRGKNTWHRSDWLTYTYIMFIFHKLQAVTGSVYLLTYRVCIVDVFSALMTVLASINFTMVY